MTTCGATTSPALLEDVWVCAGVCGCSREKCAEISCGSVHMGVAASWLQFGLPSGSTPHVSVVATLPVASVQGSSHHPQPRRPPGGFLSVHASVTTVFVAASRALVAAAWTTGFGAGDIAASSAWVRMRLMVHLVDGADRWDGRSECTTSSPACRSGNGSDD